MQLYFAYGSNLDQIAMSTRCPGARPLGPARLEAHQFFIMVEGYASVRPARDATVHGLLWRIKAEHVSALDEYEEVASGLYDRATIHVRGPAGRLPALIYLGRSRAEGVPRPGYLEAVVAAARACGLPTGYCTELRGWFPPPLA
jgi:gamma-glutamylcyclotransferase (GGCT)/AIG2-like uncharacterized protein YtfP